VAELRAAAEQVLAAPHEGASASGAPPSSTTVEVSA
jgi:hypothetical protein